MLQTAQDMIRELAKKPLDRQYRLYMPTGLNCRIQRREKGVYQVMDESGRSALWGDEEFMEKLLGSGPFELQPIKNHRINGLKKPRK